MKKHNDVMKGVLGQLQEIFDSSEQAVYIYLDDDHKACNGNFASMLGYASPEEWAAVKENFPDAFVAEGSHATLIGAYQNAMQKAVGASIEVEWKKKEGGTAKSRVILVPIAYDGHRMALHFTKQ